MPRLTVVFEYPDGGSLAEAQRMFENGTLPNLVGVEPYDAIQAYNAFNEAEGAAIKLCNKMAECCKESNGLESCHCFDGENEQRKKDGKRLF